MVISAFLFSCVYFLISLARGLSIFFSFLKELIFGFVGSLFYKCIFILVSILYYFLLIFRDLICHSVPTFLCVFIFKVCFL